MDQDEIHDRQVQIQQDDTRFWCSYTGAVLVYESERLFTVTQNLQLIVLAVLIQGGPGHSGWGNISMSRYENYVIEVQSMIDGTLDELLQDGTELRPKQEEERRVEDEREHIPERDRAEAYLWPEDPARPPAEPLRRRVTPTETS